jgi:hypothetical protein
MMMHLLQIGSGLHIVTNQNGGNGEPLKISVKPGIRGGSSVRSYGYIGNYMMELAALIELASSTAPPSNVFSSILSPKNDFPGDYVKRPIREDMVPINRSQRNVLLSLQHALEKVQVFVFNSTSLFVWPCIYVYLLVSIFPRFNVDRALRARASLRLSFTLSAREYRTMRAS